MTGIDPVFSTNRPSPDHEPIQSTRSLFCGGSLGNEWCPVRSGYRYVGFHLDLLLSILLAGYPISIHYHGVSRYCSQAVSQRDPIGTPIAEVTYPRSRLDGRTKCSSMAITHVKSHGVGQVVVSELPVNNTTVDRLTLKTLKPASNETASRLRNEGKCGGGIKCPPQTLGVKARNLLGYCYLGLGWSTVLVDFMRFDTLEDDRGYDVLVSPGIFPSFTSAGQSVVIASGNDRDESMLMIPRVT